MSPPARTINKTPLKCKEMGKKGMPVQNEKKAINSTRLLGPSSSRNLSILLIIEATKRLIIIMVANKKEEVDTPLTIELSDADQDSQGNQT